MPTVSHAFTCLLHELKKSSILHELIRIHMCGMTQTIGEQVPMLHHSSICVLHELKEFSPLHESIRIHICNMTQTIGERVPTVSHAFICVLHELKESSTFHELIRIHMCDMTQTIGERVPTVNPNRPLCDVVENQTDPCDWKPEVDNPHCRCCIVLQCVAARCGVLWCVAV